MSEAQFILLILPGLAILIAGYLKGKTKLRWIGRAVLFLAFAAAYIIPSLKG